MTGVLRLRIAAGPLDAIDGCIGTGVGGSGPLAVSQDDPPALAVASVRNGRFVRDAMDLAATSVSSREAMHERSHRQAATDWLVLRPDLLYTLLARGESRGPGRIRPRAVLRAVLGRRTPMLAGGRGG